MRARRLGRVMRRTREVNARFLLEQKLAAVGEGGEPEDLAFQGLRGYRRRGDGNAAHGRAGRGAPSRGRQRTPHGDTGRERHLERRVRKTGCAHERALAVSSPGPKLRRAARQPMVRFHGFFFSGFSLARTSRGRPLQGTAGLPAHRCALGATCRRALVTVRFQRLGRTFSHEEASEHDPVVQRLVPESASLGVHVRHVKPVPKGVHHPRWVPADPEVVHQRGAPRSRRVRTPARRERRRRPSPPERSGNFPRRCDPSRVADRAAFPFDATPPRRANRRSSGRSRTTYTSSARRTSRARSRRTPRSTRGASARRTTRRRMKRRALRAATPTTLRRRARDSSTCPTRSSTSS